MPRGRVKGHFLNTNISLELPILSLLINAIVNKVSRLGCIILLDVFISIHLFDLRTFCQSGSTGISHQFSKIHKPAFRRNAEVMRLGYSSRFFFACVHILVQSRDTSGSSNQYFKAIPLLFPSAMYWVSHLCRYTLSDIASFTRFSLIELQVLLSPGQKNVSFFPDFWLNPGFNIFGEANPTPASDELFSQQL